MIWARRQQDLNLKSWLANLDCDVLAGFSRRGRQTARLIFQSASGAKSNLNVSQSLWFDYFIPDMLDQKTFKSFSSFFNGSQFTVTEQSKVHCPRADGSEKTSLYS
jgi:hypothetical protein